MFQNALLAQQKMIETAANLTFFTLIATKSAHNVLLKGTTGNKTTKVWKISQCIIQKEAKNCEKFGEDFYICFIFHMEDAHIAQNLMAGGNHERRCRHHQLTEGVWDGSTGAVLHSLRTWNITITFLTDEGYL